MLPDLVAQWRYSWRRGSNAATATGSVLAGLALQKAEEDGVAIDEEHNRSSHAKKPPSSLAQSTTGPNICNTCVKSRRPERTARGTGRLRYRVRYLRLAGPSAHL